MTACCNPCCCGINPVCFDSFATPGKAGLALRIWISSGSSKSAEYNLRLSQRRAEAVKRYLVAQHGIPLYRIYIIGLGEQKPVEEGRTREARALNRRVEVRVFSADAAVAGAPAAPGAQTP